MLTKIGDWRYLRSEPPLDPPEPEPVKSCAWCGEDICIGDGYYALDNDDWVCESCMESAHHTAEQDDICDPWEDLRVEAAIEDWKERRYGGKKD